MYNNLSEYETSVKQSAEERLFFMRNINRESNDIKTVLSNLYEKGYNIIRQWRKMKDGDDSEFLNERWVSQHIDFIVDSYNALNEELYSSSNVGGNSRSYSLSPESALKSKIPQRLF